MKLKEFYQFRREIKKKNVLPQQTILFNPLKSSSISLPYFSKSLSSNLSGILVCRCTLNNTIFTLTSLQGKVMVSKSCGYLGFHGKKKRTTKFAVESTLLSLFEKIKELNWTRLILDFKGFSKSRVYATKFLTKSNLSFVVVRDKTSIPHNGCRPKKTRRG